MNSDIKLAFFTNPQRETAVNGLQGAVKMAKSLGCKCYISNELKDSGLDGAEEIGDITPDFVLAFGGDGTILRAAGEAMKYSASGEVDLSVGEDDDKYTISVSNPGEIAEADIDHLFERFYKADRAHTGEGTGLGLAIAKEIMELMGERIWAESKDGRVVFSFTVAKRQGTGTNTNKV